MGNSSFCNCRCNDKVTEGNLEHQQENMTLNCNNSGMKSKSCKKDRNRSLKKKNDADTELIRQNAAVYKITRFLRGCRNKRLQDNGNYSLNDRTESKNSLTSLTGKVKQKKMYRERSVKYIGEKVDGIKEGFGVQLWADGGKYVGFFNNNKAEGYGIFHADGDKYEGEFNQDGACGFGIYTHSNGAYYIGDWINDSQEPYGMETWGDGSTYKGEYCQGKKHGIGMYKWSDGATYEGEWDDNHLHGYGIYYFNNNQAYVGEWYRNMKNGFGEFIWENKRYIGYYINDKKEGFGIYYWKNVNKVFMGFWKNGRQKGFGKYMTPVKRRYGIWKSDNKIQWCNTDKEQSKYLNSNEVLPYRKIFNYTLEEINSFFLNHDITNSLLIPLNSI